MRLRSLLILGYSAVLTLAALGLGLGLITVLGLASTSEHMVRDNFRALDVASRLREMTSAQQLVVLSRLVETEGASVALIPPFQREADALLEEARNIAQTDGERKLIESVQESVDRLANSMTILAARPAAGVVDSTGGEQGFDREAETRDSVVSGFAAVSTAARAYYQYHHDEMQAGGLAIQHQSRRLALALGLLAGFTVLIGVLVSLRLAKRLSGPMERLAAAAQQLAGRDFDVRIPRSGLFETDHVAARFESMAEALRGFHALDLDRIVAERHRLDRVIAAIDDGLVIFDDAGRVERMNPVAELQLGFSAEQADGKRLSEITTLPDLEAEIDTLVASPTTELVGDSDLTVERDGEARTLSYSLLPFADAARPGLILVLRDVTEQRQFERMRTEFVLRAAHELRTPITSLRMALGLLEGKLPVAAGSREAELLKTMDDEVLRLVQLISDLLDLSRLYARSHPLKPEPCDPEELLRRCMHRFVPMVEDAGLRMGLTLDGPLGRASLDVSAIERVLDNLVANAVRHTPGGGLIELRARRDGERLFLAVRDNGEGIARRDRARVFEPFVQVGKRAGGSGLGLAMCRELVQQHGGDLRLASHPGHGSTFTVVLPV